MTEGVSIYASIHLKLEDDWAISFMTVSCLPGKEIELGRIARGAVSREQTIYAFRSLMYMMAQDWLAEYVPGSRFPEKCEGMA